MGLCPDCGSSLDEWTVPDPLTRLGLKAAPRFVWVTIECCSCEYFEVVPLNRKAGKKRRWLP